MNEPVQNAQRTSSGLWIPFTIILLGILVSTIFVVETLKGYRKPRPLLIKPSSVDSAGEISLSLNKALYPLKLQGFGVEFQSDGSEWGSELGSELSAVFGAQSKNIKIDLKKIDLTETYDNNKTDCLNTALFNMTRKKQRAWTKKIYFSVCTEKENSFSIYYSSKSPYIEL